MKEFNGTKGPWVSGEYQQGAGCPVTVSGCLIGWISYGPIYPAEPFAKNMCEANANLIAAAPDLLEALQGMVIAAENIGGESVYGLMELDNHADMARMAIAKALGETK